MNAPSPLESIYHEASSSSKVENIYKDVISRATLPSKVEASFACSDALDLAFRSGSSPIGAASTARSVFATVLSLAMHADVNARIAAGVAVEACMTTLLKHTEIQSCHSKRSTLASMLSHAIGLTGASTIEVTASSASSGSLVSFATFNMTLVLQKGTPLLSGDDLSVETTSLVSLSSSSGIHVNTTFTLAEKIAKQRSAVLTTIGLEATADVRDETSITSRVENHSSIAPGVATAIKLTRFESVDDVDLLRGIEQYEKRGQGTRSSNTTTAKSSTSTRLDSSSILPKKPIGRSARIETITLGKEGDNVASAAYSELIVLFNTACFHLFDAYWGKRHGAVLLLRGILLSMLRFSCSAEEELQGNDRGSEEENGHAALEDLVLRLTIVLALDRYSDFGSRSLVSIVRDATAQALSLAAARLPTIRLLRVVSALQQVSQHDDWHARHGSALGLNATVSLILRSHLMLADEVRKPVTDAGAVALTLLCDRSDDVSSVAGDLLLRIVQSEVTILNKSQIGNAIQSSAERLEQFLTNGRSEELDDASISPLPPVLLSLLRSLLATSLIEQHINDALIRQICDSASIYIEYTLPTVRVDAIHILIRICQLQLSRLLAAPSEQLQPGTSKLTGKKRGRPDASSSRILNDHIFSTWWNQQGFLRIVSSALRFHVLEIEDELEVDIPANGHIPALTYLISSTIAPKLLTSESKSLIEDDISLMSEKKKAFFLITCAFELDKHTSSLIRQNREAENRAREWFIRSLSAFAGRDGDALQASQLRPTGSGENDTLFSNLSLSPAIAINFRKRTQGAEILAYLLSGNSVYTSSSSPAIALQMMSLNDIALSLGVLTDSTSSTSTQTVALLTSAFWRFVDVKKISPSACLGISQILEPLFTFFRLPSDSDVDRSPIIEASSSFLDLSMACGDLHGAIEIYKSETKLESRKKKVKAVQASEALIDLRTATKNAEQALTEAQTLIIENNATPIPALLAEVILQVDRTRKLLLESRKQTLRWCVSANACIAAALFAPSLRIARSRGSSYAWDSCLPQRITPIIRSLLDGAGCGVSLGAPLLGLWVPAFSSSVLASFCSACWMSSSSSLVRDVEAIGSLTFDKIASAVVKSENASAAASLSLVTFLQRQGCTVALRAVCDALTSSSHQTNSCASLVSLPTSSTFVLAACVIVASENGDNSELLDKAVTSALSLVSIAFNAFLQSTNVSHTAIVLTCATASLRFHTFVELVAEHLLPKLLSPQLTTVQDADFRERSLKIIHYSLLGSFEKQISSPFLTSFRTLLVDKKCESQSLRNILAQYGASLFPAAVSCLAHTSETVRSNAASLLRLLVDSLPVFTKGDAVRTDITLKMNLQLTNAFLRGQELKELLEKGARRSFERLPPSVAKALMSDQSQLDNNLFSIESNQTVKSSSFVLPKSISPAGLGDLRPYQLEGIEWMTFLRQNNLGGILADDMGLGKTAQTIISIALAVQSGETNFPPLSVIVCPATLVHHWSYEVEKIYGKDSFLKTIIYSGTHPDRIAALSQLVPKSSEQPKRVKLSATTRAIEKSTMSVNTHTLLITSFSVLRRDVDKICTASGDKGFAFLIVDEAHAASNPASALFSCLQTLSTRSRHRFCLSGTPIQNKPEDLWALLSLALPGALGTLIDFKSHIASPVRRARSPHATESDMALARQALAALQRQALPFVLRRLKGDVLSELPPKTISDIIIDLAPKQVQLYSAFLESLKLPKKANNSSDTPQSSMFALQSLRHIVNHPNCLDDPLRSSLLRTNSNTVPSLQSSKKRPTRGDIQERTLSSQSVTAYPVHDSCKLIALGSLLRRLGLSEAGSTSSRLLDGSSDLGIGLQDLDEGIITTPSLSAQTRKILIFAQQPRTLDAIHIGLLKVFFPSIGCSRIDGSVPTSTRVGLANRFNDDASLQLMLLTTVVGGLGLNLTGADTVIFYDHDWNPFKDLQAMDRAHRLGQKNKVSVYRLLARDTFEERVMSLQRFKVAVADSAIGSGSSAAQSHTSKGGEGIQAFRSSKSVSRGDDNDQEEEDEGSDVQSMSLDTFLDIVLKGKEE